MFNSHQSEMCACLFVRVCMCVFWLNRTPRTDVSPYVLSNGESRSTLASRLERNILKV